MAFRWGLAAIVWVCSPLRIGAVVMRPAVWDARDACAQETGWMGGWWVRGGGGLGGGGGEGVGGGGGGR